MIKRFTAFIFAILSVSLLGACTGVTNETTSVHEMSPGGLVFPTTTVRGVPSPAPAPWPGVVTYTEQTYEIDVNIGEEFAIGMFMTGPVNFIELYDQNTLDLLDDQIVEYHSNALNMYGTEWFLFKAIKAGNSEIVFKYPLEYTKLFKVYIH